MYIYTLGLVYSPCWIAHANKQEYKWSCYYCFQLLSTPSFFSLSLVCSCWIYICQSKELFSTNFAPSLHVWQPVLFSKSMEAKAIQELQAPHFTVIQSHVIFFEYESIFHNSSRADLENRRVTCTADRIIDSWGERSQVSLEYTIRINSHWWKWLQALKGGVSEVFFFSIWTVAKVVAGTKYWPIKVVKVMGGEIIT